MRKVFFSFHYKNDIFRANVVRNSWVRAGSPTAAGFEDRSMWEDAHTRNDRRLSRMIADALHGTSVTVVLIGEETCDRFWVEHEILRSFELRKGLLGVRIHGIRDLRTGRTSRKGPNPFEGLVGTDADGYEVALSDHVAVRDWVRDDGYANFSDWVEQAAQDAGR